MKLSGSVAEKEAVNEERQETGEPYNSVLYICRYKILKISRRGDLIPDAVLIQRQVSIHNLPGRTLQKIEKEIKQKF